MSDIIKTGTLSKFSSNAFNSKWTQNYVELCQNSTFRWYDKKGESSPKRSIILKNVSAFLAFGDIVKQLPFKPDLKPDQFELIIAIPHENNRNTRLSFFLCSNESEMKDWVNTILNTITDNFPPSSSVNPTSMRDSSQITPVNSGVQYTGPYAGGPPQAGGQYGGPPQAAGAYGGPPPTGGSYGGPPPAGGPYGGPPQAGGSYGGPPPVGGSYGGPQFTAGQYGGPPPGSGPYAGPPHAGGSYGGSYGGPPPVGGSYGGPPPAYHAGTGPPIGFNIGGNAPAGNYPQANYPQSSAYPQPALPTGGYSGFPNNPPVGTSTGYRPGVVQQTNYPRQPGYAAAGAQYVPGNPPLYDTSGAVYTAGCPSHSSSQYQVPGVSTGYQPGIGVTTNCATQQQYRAGGVPVSQPTQSFVIIDGKKKKKHSKIKNAAIGLAAGAATAYAAHKVFGGHHGWGGHGWGHGWGGGGFGYGDHGWGHMHYGGSWSSLSSGSWSD